VIIQQEVPEDAMQKGMASTIGYRGIRHIAE